jgi:hypothetical protein
MPSELAWLRFQHIGPETDWQMSLWQHDEQIVVWAQAKLPGHLDLQLDPPTSNWRMRSWPGSTTWPMARSAR